MPNFLGVFLWNSLFCEVKVPKNLSKLGRCFFLFMVFFLSWVGIQPIVPNRAGCFTVAGADGKDSAVASMSVAVVEMWCGLVVGGWVNVPQFKHRWVRALTRGTRRSTWQ